jgi:hypothetical protein
VKNAVAITTKNRNAEDTIIAGAGVADGIVKFRTNQIKRLGFWPFIVYS